MPQRGAAPDVPLRYCNIATAPKETGDSPGSYLRITIKRYANTCELRYTEIPLPPGGVTLMLYIVEIPIDGDLTERMGQMRTWLDHLRCEPGAFRSASAGGRTFFRVEFIVETEARAFAQ